MWMEIRMWHYPYLTVASNRFNKLSETIITSSHDLQVLHSLL
jgi:hypothetical protein